MDTNVTVTPTHTSYTDYDTDVSDVSLRRIASCSNSSLNFGTNIFKRFADRMSGGNNSSPNSTKTPIRTTNKNISN